MTDHSFKVLDTTCGSGSNNASVDRGDSSVVVKGTIDGRNSCYTAELKNADYDADADKLTVDVRSYESSDGDTCAQCIVDIDYRATFKFRGGTPDEVTVNHNGKYVTSD